MGRTAGKIKQEMTLIDFGDFKIRFDPKEVRINIDGEIVDVGARRTEEESFNPDDYEIPPPGYGFIGGPRLKKKSDQKSP